MRATSRHGWIRKSPRRCCRLQRRRGLGARRRLGARRGGRAPRSPAIHVRARSIRRSWPSSSARQPARGLDAREIVRLFAARDADYRRGRQRGRRTAPRETSGDTVALRRQPQHQLHQHLLLRANSAPSPRERRTRRCAARPMILALEEIVRRAHEAWERGATEVCMQGGIHPTTPARPISASAAAVQGGGPGHAHPRLLAAGGHAGRRDARACRSRTFLAKLQGGRTRHLAGHRRRDPRRRGARRASAPTS